MLGKRDLHGRENVKNWTMAERRALNRLHQNVANTNENSCLNSFLTCASCTKLPGMSYDGVRLKWTGDLTNLKRIVREVCPAVGPVEEVF